MPFKRAARHEASEPVDIESRLEPFFRPPVGVVVADRPDGGPDDQDR